MKEQKTSYLGLALSMATGMAHFGDQSVEIQPPTRYQKTSNQQRARILKTILEKHGEGITSLQVAAANNMSPESMRSQLPILRSSLSQITFGVSAQKPVTGHSLILTDQIFLDVKDNKPQGTLLRLNTSLLEAAQKGADFDGIRLEPFQVVLLSEAREILAEAPTRKLLDPDHVAEQARIAQRKRARSGVSPLEIPNFTNTGN